MANGNKTGERETYVSPPVPYDFGAQEPLGNPALDNVMTCLIAMGAEMWATRRRLSALEAVLEENGIPASAVSSYVPSDEQEAEWNAERDRFIQMALAPLGDSAFRKMSSTENDFTDF
ncbi:MAG: hypothetical protein ACI87W_001875 [Halieaceae bacterium]|jgi:hypothetical protein